MRVFPSFALASVLACTGCQLVFPLADVDGTGGEGSGTTRATVATGSSSDSASGPSGPGATTGGGACGDATCETYCAGVFDRCAGTPQYHTRAECCAVCATWDGPDRECRVNGGTDALSCTLAGPFGGGLACSNACAEMCALYASVCPAEVPDDCEEKCAEDWDASLTFDACHPGVDDSRTCRMSRLLEATAGDPMACKRAKDGKCPGMGMMNVCMP